MASETLGGDDSKEKHRWGDNKVYTRKNRIKKDNGTTTTNNSAAQQSSQTLATTTEDGNSSQPQDVSNRFNAASDDSSSHNRVQAAAFPNGGESVSGKGPEPYVRFGDRVRINLQAARSRLEVSGLKRKLMGELEQVRGLVKKLEAREVQLNGYFAVDEYSHSQVSANHVVNTGRSAIRVNSDVGSVGHHLSRPFGGLTVSVTENNFGDGEFYEKEKRTPKVNQYYRNSDFVCGTEKFPQPESNKKSKTNGFGMDKYLNQIFKRCSDLLAKLMKHKHGWVFNEPVDVVKLGLHDYHIIIKHPMDLGTVKNRLNKNWYKSPREFAEDVILTFHNAMTYNPKGQDVHIMAEELLNIFEEKWVVIEEEYIRHREMGHGAGLPTPTLRKAPHSHAPPRSQMETLDRSQYLTMPGDSNMKPQYETMPGDSNMKTSNSNPLGRTPALKKPKARDLHKREMSFEEKQKLSKNLENLPCEKLEMVVQIIKKSNSALSQHDDEIEVDIDSVDVETLWELDRFVTNYKKSLSKNRRKAELAQSRIETLNSIQKTNPAAVGVEIPIVTKTGERNDSTSPVRVQRQGDNVSGSSSSSSSSSDSGSSSSDSDSDSSSGSDAGHSPRS